MKIAFLGNPGRYSGDYAEYRRWPLEESYGYTLLFEPSILNICRELPVIIDGNCAAAYDKYDMLVIPELKEGSAIENFLCVREEFKAIVVMPTERVIGKRFGINVKKCIEKVPSLKESWHMEGCTGRKYIYPSGFDFQIIMTDDAEVLSSIGENPDFVIGKYTGMYATDFFKAIAAHLNEPILPLLLNDCSMLLADGILKLAGSEPAPKKGMDERYNQLRRDFNAAGFALMVMNELAASRPSEKDFITRYEEYMISAADEFMSCKPDLCEMFLKKAFMLLLEYRMDYLKKDIYFIDTAHAGGMFKDIGYFEFDWPEKTAEFLCNLMEWVEKRNFKFCLDFSAGSLEYFLIRYPMLKNRLTAAIKCGNVEIVNGTYAQPYPLLYSNESMLRQLEFGNMVIRELFNVDVKTYASQEFGFTSGIPALLKLAGYDTSVGRVYNQGNTPCNNKKLISWRSKDGSTIRTLPGHTYPYEKEYDFTYSNLHIKLLEASSHDTGIIVSTAFGDASYYLPFREEMARVCYYAPVFGSFCTFGDYFKRFVQIEDTYEIVSDDLQFEGYFLNLENWETLHARHAGGNNRHGCIIEEAEERLLNLESITALLEAVACKRYHRLMNEWKCLLYYEGHDNYIVPYEYAGEFMRDQGNLIHYCGPVKHVTIREKNESDLMYMLNDAEEQIDYHLDEIGDLFFKRYDLADTYIAYNFSPARRIAREVRETGEFIYTDGSPVIAQKIEGGTLLWLDLPAYGYRLIRVKFDIKNKAMGNVRRDCTFMDDKLYSHNKAYTLCISLKTGIIEFILDKQIGKEILVNANRMSYKDCTMEACNVELLEDGPIRQSFVITGKLVSNMKAVAMFTNTVELHADSRVIHFKAMLEPIGSMNGDSWEDSIKIAFGFPSPVRHVYRNCSNIIEETRLDKFSSLYFTRVETEDGTINFYNYGNKLYRLHDNELENILVFVREPMRMFEYDMEINAPWGVQEAIKTVTPCYMRRLKGHSHSSGHAPGKNGFYEEINGHGEISLFTYNAENVLITSMRAIDGRMVVTYNEVAGIRTLVYVKSLFDICEAYTCDLTGRPVEKLRVDDTGSFPFWVEPWEIKLVSHSLA